jgi:hypothetical protein
MLYRILRPDQNWKLGLFATNPNSDISVVDHVTKGKKMGWKSPYISTCGSLISVLELRREIGIPNAQIVQISEDNLPVVKIDLRTSSNRDNHYVPGEDSTDLINTFHYVARVYEEVLLVGYVPKTHIKPLSESDFVVVQLPV